MALNHGPINRGKAKLTVEDGEAEVIPVI